jgi:hypothetical protein
VLAFAQASAVPTRVVSLPKDIQDMLEISSKRMSDLVHCTSEKDCKDPRLPRCIRFALKSCNGVKNYMHYSRTLRIFLR